MADLEKIGAGAPWLAVTECVERGSLLDAVARSGARDGHDIYVAGPTSMVAATTERLTLLGAPRDQIYVEDFGWSVP
jgi:ferredoxin-NADP reductase